MPAVRNKNFRSGDKAELLAEYILSSLAFTAKVPRPEDIGYDFFCSLAHKEGKLEVAGPFFTVQSKSNLRRLTFKKAYEVYWLTEQENPYFLCRVRAKDLAIDLFSTWNVANGYLLKATERISLHACEQAKNQAAVQFRNEDTELHVYLGKPMLTMTAAETQDEDIVAERVAVLEQWIKFERYNIAHRQSEMYWVTGPSSYETNKMPVFHNPQIAFYWHPDNLQGTLLNFTRNATHLRLLLDRFPEPAKVLPDADDPIGSLDEALRSYAFAVEPLAKKTLDQHLSYSIFNDREE